MDLMASRAVFSEPDSKRLVRRLRRVVGGDLSDHEVADLANGDLNQVVGLAMPAQQAVMALVKPQANELGELEKIVGSTIDYVGIAFLDRARAAALPVVRVVGTDMAAIGTGVMVSSRLVLTNNHVTGNSADANSQLIQFRYELDIDGAHVATTEYRLDPATFFFTSPENQLDFSLIAVGSRSGGSGELASSFGFIPLSSASDKHAEGDFVTIIEHPEGTYKQIALRENRVLGRGKRGRTLYYGADTLGGSSGSPVFNDQFEMVALHHAGGPRNDTLLDTGKPVPRESNEGIRISAIVERLERELKTLAAQQRDLLAGALDPPQRGPTRPDTPPAQSSTAIAIESARPTIAIPDGSGGRQRIEILVPIAVDIGVGAPQQAAGITEPTATRSHYATPDLGLATALERNNPPDPNYGKRKGYSETFLTTPVPLPKLTAAIKNKPAKYAGSKTVLPYLHFSTVQSKERKLPYFTAVNIDGAHAPKRVDRKTGEVVFDENIEAAETWYSDPRLPGEQLTDAFYGHQAFRVFDRGHMVRRLDPAWGEKSTILSAADDTFHFTNCCPQAWQFNEQVKYWAGIEDYVLENAKATKSRISVFSGPFFTDDDPVFWGTKIPKAFWKILIRIDPTLGLRATGFIADQSTLLEAAQDRLERITWGDWNEITRVKQYARPISEIAKRAKLDFDSLADHDSYVGDEAIQPREIQSFADIPL
jgi:endonuclease G, mitochondrial